MLQRSPPHENKINRHIRERIRQAREERGASQEDLAEAVYKSRVAISDLERGKAQVNAADLVLIAGFLEKPIMYFFEGQGTIDPRSKELDATEQELVWLFRQLDHDALQNLALAQIRTLAESARQADLKAQYEELRREAEQRDIHLS